MAPSRQAGPILARPNWKANPRRRTAVFSGIASDYLRKPAARKARPAVRRATARAHRGPALRPCARPLGPVGPGKSTTAGGRVRPVLFDCNRGGRAPRFFAGPRRSHTRRKSETCRRPARHWAIRAASLVRQAMDGTLGPGPMDGVRAGPPRRQRRVPVGRSVRSFHRIRFLRKSYCHPQHNASGR